MTTMTEPNETEQEHPASLQDVLLQLDVIEQQEVADLRASRAEWKAIICSIANGRTVDLASVHATLARLRLTHDDLTDAVYSMKERQRDAETFAAFPQSISDIKRLNAEIREADDAYREFMRAHEEKVISLIEARRNAESAMTDACFAKDRLITTCTDPEALEQVNRLDRRMDALRHAMPELKGQADQKRLALRSWIDTEDEGYSADIERVQAEVDKMDAEYAAMRVECNHINDVLYPAAQLHLLVPEAI